MKFKKVIIISLIGVTLIGLSIGSYFGYKEIDQNNSNEKALKDLEYTREVLRSKLVEKELKLENIKNEDPLSKKKIRNYTFNLYYYDFIKCMSYEFIIDKISISLESIFDIYSYDTPTWDYMLKSSFKELESLDGYFIIDNYAYDISSIKRIRYYTSNFKGKAQWDINEDKVELFESSYIDSSNHIYPHTDPLLELV